MVAVAALVVATIAAEEMLIRICGLFMAFEFAWLLANQARVVHAYRTARRLIQ